MPLTRKTQALVKIETIEGTNAAPDQNDALGVFDLNIGPDDVQVDERAAANSGTLTKPTQPVGRSSRPMSFSMDFKGSGVIANAPPWAVPVRACSMFEVAPRFHPMTSVSGCYQPGELVEIGSSNRQGIVLNKLDGDGDLYMAWIRGAVPSASETITGVASGTTGTAGSGGSQGFAYLPDSERVASFTCTFSATAPALGEVVAYTRSGKTVGAAQVIAINGNVYDIIPHWGDPVNGDTAVATTGGGSGTISNYGLTRSPSVTIAGNRDGYRRDAVGARGSFTLSGSAGSFMQLAFNFTGLVDLNADALRVTGASFPSTVAPRLAGIVGGVGTGVQFQELPIQGIEVDLGNTVSPKGDANAPSGFRYANVTDRTPTVTVEFDQVGKGSIDFHTLQQTGSPLRFGALLGSVAGNRVGIAGNKMQVVGVNDQDNNGTATFSVRMACRQAADGDDELVLFQI